MFSIAQVVLLLSTSDSEFGLTIVLAVAAILSYWVINVIVSVWVCGVTYWCSGVMGACVPWCYVGAF